MNFSIHHTNTGKGVALILLLIHHLFFQTEFFYNDWIIGDTHMLMKFAEFSKVCVGIFVFLSGFGLFRSQSKAQLGFKDFVSLHFVKIYLNYWLIWLLFVPVGLLFFDLSFTSIYGDNYWDKLLINILGFQQVFNFWGLNPTWWFIGCIISLYLIFPFCFTLANQFNYLFLFFIVFVSILSINVSFFRTQPYEPIREYLLTFVLGVIVAKNNLFEKLNKLRLNYILRTLITIIGIAAIVYIRFHLGKRSLILTDGIISFFILYIIFQFKNQSKLLIKLGEHSFNIFLFHTFIYYYYLNSIIFLTTNPFLIFATLLFLCVFISYVIEFVKNWLGFYRLQNYFLQYLAKL